MKSGDLFYANSIKAKTRPGPRPPMAFTYGVTDRLESLVCLYLGTVKEPLTQEQLDQVITSWGWAKLPSKEVLEKKAEHLYAMLNANNDQAVSFDGLSEKEQEYYRDQVMYLITGLEVFNKIN